MSTENIAALQAAVRERRTFAIISHPDAGKTTLTEKLLLYSGQIRTAGMVRGRKASKAASSDWMGMEQERGISITSSAMQFHYRGALINVLDTPGHQDFSEDTYRTLTAADCAIMVVDAARGIQAQTRKLFEVCHLRGIPVLTFINKMDLPGRAPLDLMTEVEEALGIQAVPFNWPVGSGKEFRGVIGRESREVMLFERTAAAGAQKADMETVPLDELSGSGKLDEDVVERLTEDLELLEIAGNTYTHEDFLGGKVTPMFFGSALTNFGLEPFFDTFVEIAPCPGARDASDDAGEPIAIEPADPRFSAFVFKIQANMDPRHRDSVAFLRICSGVFRRDMAARTNRSPKPVRLSRPHGLMAGERQTLDEAFPGDVIGIINSAGLQIGDTVTEKGGFTFPPLPMFQPEIFGHVNPKKIDKRKAYDKGLKQLVSEGTAQLMRSIDDPTERPIVAAAGRLQFEVLQYRLDTEYGVETVVESLPFACSCWVIGDPETLKLPIGSKKVLDAKDRPAVLFRGQWEKDYALRENPDHEFHDVL